MREPRPHAKEVSIDEMATQLEQLGVEAGDVLLVHTSFRALRPVEGGPLGFVEALTRAVGEAGTVVMPSWPEDADELFDPAETPADPDLGVVADQFWRRPGAERTEHCQAFAARGPHAARILVDPLPLPPHRPESPVGRVHDLDGKILLVGVNHDADTTIHLAEVIAGVPYGIPHRCTAVVDGRVVTVEYRENDHCCERFRLVDDWLGEGSLQSEGRVGHAEARLVRSRDVVATVVPRLEREPLLFLHEPEAGCDDCNAARTSTYAE